MHKRKRTKYSAIPFGPPKTSREPDGRNSAEASGTVGTHAARVFGFMWSYAAEHCWTIGSQLGQATITVSCCSWENQHLPLENVRKGMRVSWGKFVFLSPVKKSTHFAWGFPQQVWLFSGEGSWRGITPSVALLWKYPARRWSSVVDTTVTPTEFRKSVFCFQPSSWLPVTLTSWSLNFSF